MRRFQDQTDEELVALYVDGNNEAFDALVDRCKDKVYSYIFHQLKDEELANDVFQETFVKAVMTLKQGKYTENGKFIPWITRIAHNLVIDVFRQEKNATIYSCDSSEINILNRKDLCEETIEDSLVTSQIHKDIRMLVKALPNLQRQVLEMRYYKDMSFKEIADVTGVSINTALGRMRYAIMNMRKMAEENNIALEL